jgi:prepilin-type N-terminal cleavage/methylation domain-containing protein
MRATLRHILSNKGFTVIELLIVIAVIAVLATLVIVGYGGWKNTTLTSQIKSDLNGVASAMESARNFTSIYPASIPSTFTASSGSVLSGGSTDGGVTYCIDATTSSDPSITYYIASESKDKGALSGTCATRPGLPVPGVPTGLTINSTSGTTIGLSWSASSNAVSYTAQCASDAAFVVGPQSSTVTSPTVSTTVNGLNNISSYYCRVSATNANGTSSWSATAGSTTTTNTYGALAIATSIEGYWTSAPTGFLLEDGSAVSRSTYSDLFGVIGTTYGVGDGSSTFNLPDSRGRTPINLSSTDAEFNTVGKTYGEKTHQLTIAEIPSHTHIQNPHNHNNGAANPYVTDGSIGSIVVWTANGSAFGFKYGLSPSATATNQSTGGNSAHNVIQPSIVKTAAIKFAPADSTAQDLPVAASSIGYWSSAPNGYLLEDGSAVSRATYATLFAAIGTTYGAGNGSTTFNVPDSRARASVNKSPSDAEFNTIGEKYGEKAHTLTVNEMPSHTHIQNAHNHNNGAANPYVTDGSFGGLDVSSAAATYYGFRLGAGPSATATNQNTGGSGSHNVIQPSIVKVAAIKYTATTGSGSIVSTGTSSPGYWSSAPTGYLAEDGSAVSRTTYANLFSVIGTTYGAGNGSTTFNVPDSRGRISVNISPTDAEFNTMGEKYGEKTHLLTIAEMANHTHTQNAHNHAIGMYTSGSEAGGYGLTNGAGGFFDRTIVGGGGMATSSTTATNQSTGGGQAYNVIQPSIVKLFVIKT